MKSDYLTPVCRCIGIVAEFPVKAFHILILHFWTKQFLHGCVKLVIIDHICIVTKCKDIVTKFQGLRCLLSSFSYLLIYFLISTY